MKITAEFDQWSDGYTQKIKRWVPFYEEMLNGVLTGLPPGFTPERILDLGAGNGNLSALLWEQYPHAHITLLDASPEMLRICQDRFADRTAQFSLMESFFQAADFPAQSFDLIVAGLALHHLDSTEKQVIFSQLFTWLRPGGWLMEFDLFASKREPDYVQTVLADWEHKAKALGTPEDEWTYLMDHHAEYDKPDHATDQITWMEAAGFQDATFVWRDVYWGTLRAQRP